MKKTISIKRIISIIILIGEIMFAFYIGIMTFTPNTRIDTLGLFYITIIFCAPACVGIYLFILSEKNDEIKRKAIKAFLFMVFIFYIMILIYLLFKGRSVNEFRGIREYINYNTNFIPFKTIIMYIQRFLDNSINKSIVAENLFGNLLLFAPMGIFLPCLFPDLRRFKKFMIVMLIALIIIEIVQFATQTGGMDIDDVILNLTGAIILYWFWNLSIGQRLLRKAYVIL